MGRQSEWQTFDRILWIFGQSASRWHCTCRLRFWYKGISWFLLCNTQNFCIYKAQLTGIEVEQTRRIANVCIHVERVIGNLWQKYSRLSGVQPIDFVTVGDEETACTLDKIVCVAWALINTCDSVVPYECLYSLYHEYSLLFLKSYTHTLEHNVRIHITFI